MKQVSVNKVNRSAPNLINICIDHHKEGEMKGRLYHCYQKDAVPFENVVEMIRQSEKFFDRIAFPQASTKTRSLIDQKAATSLKPVKRPEKVVDAAEVMINAGKLGTFITNVKFRQSSEWQGELLWAEKDETRRFNNTIELIKVLDEALQNYES